jgi:hypothetical protein
MISLECIRICFVLFRIGLAFGTFAGWIVPHERSRATITCVAGLDSGSIIYNVPSKALLLMADELVCKKSLVKNDHPVVDGRLHVLTEGSGAEVALSLASKYPREAIFVAAGTDITPVDILLLRSTLSPLMAGRVSAK